MNNHFILRIILILGVCLIAEQALLSANQQINSGLSKQTSTLLPLVGQKCSVFLKNGNKISGTLWDIGEDFITLKVKKGLLYSKAEKFGFSEIDFIEDMNGKKIKMAELESKNQLDQKQENTEASKLYFHTGDLIKEEEKETKQPEKSESYENIQNLLNQNQQFKYEPIPEKPKYFSEEENESFEQNKTNKLAEKSSADKYDKSEVVIVNRNKKNEPYNPKQSRLFSPVKKQAKKITNPSKTQVTKIQEPSPRIKTPAPVKSANETSQKLKILRYQTFILFGAAILIIFLIMFFKITGLKGSALGKFSIFPARLVKMSGQYGIIDQGTNDGVKVDDMIRLYRKAGRNVTFKGKVRVLKVADSYAAVELVKNKKYESLEVGDVGFRDRNFIYTTLKKIRILTSYIFSGLGKSFSFAAQNLEVKPKEPSINYGIFHKEDKPRIIKTKKPVDKKPAKQITQKEAPVKPVKPATAKTQQSKSVPPEPKVSAIKPEEDTQLIGFGLEED